MLAMRASERGFTLYQLLVSLVVLVIAVSLGLAYQHSRHPRPFFADLEHLEAR
jgi:Tfp pilus assembly protein PilV